MGKIQGLKVEADATVDGAFANSPESYVVRRGRAEKTQGESGVSSVENIQSLKVWMATHGKRPNSQSVRQTAVLRWGSAAALRLLFRVIKKGNTAKEVHSIHVLAVKATAA